MYCWYGNIVHVGVFGKTLFCDMAVGDSPDLHPVLLPTCPVSLVFRPRLNVLLSKQDDSQLFEKVVLKVKCGFLLKL